MIERPATRADLRAVVDLLCAYDEAYCGAADAISDEWDQPDFDLAEHTLVVADDSALVGYAALIGEYVEAVTSADRTDLLPRLLDWAEAHAGALEHLVLDTDPRRNELMASRAWVPVRRFWRMRRALDGPLPTPSWPPGVVQRPYDRPGDDRAVHHLITTSFRDIGGQHERSFEQWRGRLVGTERFDPELCLVAEDRGELVGVALTEQMSAEYGSVDHLAVARSSRGRGIALALLYECFRRHAGKGLPVTELDVNAANPTGALRLYEVAGMAVVKRLTCWQRPAT